MSCNSYYSYLYSEFISFHLFYSYKSSVGLSSRLSRRVWCGSLNSQRVRGGLRRDPGIACGVTRGSEGRAGTGAGHPISIQANHESSLVTSGSKDEDHRAKIPGSLYSGVPGIHWAIYVTLHVTRGMSMDQPADCGSGV